MSADAPVTPAAPAPESYPWTLEPASRFSGALDPRKPVTIPCWTSKTRILAAIKAALETAEGILARRSEGAGSDGTGGGISARTVMAVAGEDCDTADGATGRNIMTAHETVSRRLSRKGLKISAGSVRKARRLLRRLGFQAVVEEGRYLTKTERLKYSIEHAAENAARVLAGRKPFVPWRKASTRVFTMDAGRAVQSAGKTGHLPRRGSLREPVTKVVLTKKRLRAVSEPDHAPAGQASKPVKKPKRRPNPKAAAPRPLEIQRMAAELRRDVPWLHRVGHQNTICDVLIRAGVDPQLWTAARLILALNDRSTQRGWMMPGVIANPAGYLAHLLKDLDPAKAAEKYYRPGRAAEAAAAAENARIELERRTSTKHRAEQLAGWQRVRNALHQAQSPALAA